MCDHCAVKGNIRDAAAKVAADVAARYVLADGGSKQQAAAAASLAAGEAGGSKAAQPSRNTTI